METTVVNIMDIERYQFAGVIAKDKKSIPWTDFINGLESSWILIVVLNFIAFYYMSPCSVFFFFFFFRIFWPSDTFYRNSENRKENGKRRTGSGDVASWIWTSIAYMSTVAQCIGTHASTTVDGIIVVFLKGNISMCND